MLRTWDYQPGGLNVARVSLARGISLRSSIRGRKFNFPVTISARNRRGIGSESAWNRLGIGLEWNSVGWNYFKRKRGSFLGTSTAPKVRTVGKQWSQKSNRGNCCIIRGKMQRQPGYRGFRSTSRWMLEAMLVELSLLCFVPSSMGT